MCWCALLCLVAQNVQGPGRDVRGYVVKFGKVGRSLLILKRRHASASPCPTPLSITEGFESFE